MSLGRYARGALGGLLFLVAACDRGEGDAALDRAALRARLSADEAVVRLLGDANLLVARGKSAEALALVDGKIAPLSTENAARARELSTRSAWGKTTAPEVRALADDREASVKAYRDALTSDDVERVVSAMEKEKPLDQRALELASRLDLPSPRGGCG